MSITPYTHRKSGFGLLSLLVTVVVLAVLGYAGWSMYQARVASVVPAGLPAVIAQITHRGDHVAVVNGTVTYGPTSPICRSGISCSAPLAYRTLEVKTTGGVIVTTTTTDGSGAYTLRLAPGSYIIVGVPSVGLGGGKQITVGEGTNHIDISFDSGLR